MSGDVQPRKRKEKRRKKEDSEEIPSSFSSDEQLHVHKDASTGGNICAKILFFLLSFVLLVMIGLVVLEYRGSSDDESLVPVSKWASTFDGWLETPVKHDEHADVTESGEQEHGESGEHETESAEGEEHLSEEATSKEDEEEEGKESEEEETKSAEEEEDEDEESDKLEDEGSEEVDENESEEIEDTDDDDGEDEEQEGSDEDVYERTKSEEDVEGEEDGTEEDDYEEEDAESGRDEPDEEEEEGEAPAYGRESDEIDDVLSEIPGITESDEDEEGDDLGRSDEVIDKLQKIPGVHEKKIKATSEEVDQPRRKQEKEVGGESKNSKTTQDKTVVEEEEEEEDEPEPSGVALKFGVGVALVIVAHVVLVKKWNSDDNLATPDTSDASQNVSQIQQQQISKQIPHILVEPETEKDSEESSYLSSEYITRRQTLLPDDLVRDSPQRELEESESSVPSEEETDDGQEEFIFKQNVYKAENAFKASHRDEKPLSEEKPHKQPSFEELMKKYHELSPEGSDIESDEDEQEEEEEEEDDDRDLDEEDDDELIDDEDELDNEEPEEEISKNKIQVAKITTPPVTESTSPRKFLVDTQKEQRIAHSGEQEAGHHEEDELLAGGKEEEEEEEEEDAGELDSEDDSLGGNFKHYQLPKTRKLQREEDDGSGSEKEAPVTKSKIPKNMGGQNAQIYSKADITNEDDWHIIQDLDRADDDADEDLNF